MVKVDLKDRKIIYHLDLDSRQSLTQIGKKIGLTKEVVSYRLKRLNDKGIIKNFYTVIDTYKLGYTNLRFYLTYQYANPGIKKEIIDYFVKSKYANVIHSVEGSYDLVAFMMIKDLSEFYNFWHITLSKYRDYFANQVFSLYFQVHYYRYSFLLDEKTDRTKMRISGGGKRVEIDDLDYQILKILAPNARISTVEIAKKLDSNAITINNRIKKLIELHVIQRFRVNVDFLKLGYQLFKVDINLKDHKKLHQIIKYVETNPNFIEIDTSLGYADLELDFCLRNANHLHQIMDDIGIRFPNVIRNYQYFSVMKTHKNNYLPGE